MKATTSDPMDVDDVLYAEIDAERKIREILLDLQARTYRRVEWVKVDTRDMNVTVNTVSN